MKKDKSLTLFVDGKKEYLRKWEDYVYNFNGIKVVDNLNIEDYGLFDKKGNYLQLDIVMKHSVLLLILNF